MSALGQKLYPPVIANSIPAFYNEDGTAIIAVPFSMSRAVTDAQVSGLVLKIKTVQNNVFIKTIELDKGEVWGEVTNAVNTHIAKFPWYNIDSSNLIQLGQYVKIQLAYKDTNGVVGYFSTVAVTKYTSKPNVIIKDAVVDTTTIGQALFKQTYTGICKMNEDLNERPVAYCFYLYDGFKRLVESSGWKTHNSSMNNILKESINPDETSDTYTYESTLEKDKDYYIMYAIRTVNNLEVYSPLYGVIDIATINSEVQANLIAKNNFDNAYIDLSFQLYTNPTPEGGIGEYNAVSLEISRASKDNNFTDWKTITKTFFTTYEELLDWSFKDFSVEQGVTYKYSFRQYNKSFIYSNRSETEEVLADFEDIFLWDGKKQVRIRFNPKVSTFKTTVSEQKLETIGGHYPFIFKNGIINYKEFPISGLITYNADNDELFVNYEKDLGIVLPSQFKRLKNPNDGDTRADNAINTYSISNYNTYAERIFKLKLLEWLNNSSIKMFKSPTEGNYLVRLMNVSLTPEDRVGRMLHTFQATAYETETLTYNNLVNLKFINPDELTTGVKQISGIKISDIINKNWKNVNTSIQLNGATPNNYLQIQASPNTSFNSFYVRIGGNSVANKTLLTKGLRLEDINTSSLSNIFINYSDNAELITINPNATSTQKKQALMSLVGDAVINYDYILTTVPFGELYNLKDIYIQDTTETYVGSDVINFGPASIINQPNTIILTLTNLQFFKKANSKISLVYSNGHYINKDTDEVVSRFNQTAYYKVYTSKDSTTFSYGISNNGIDLTTVNSLDYTFTLINKDGSEEAPIQAPLYIPSLDNAVYSGVRIGNGVCLTASHKDRTVYYYS